LFREYQIYIKLEPTHLRGKKNRLSGPEFANHWAHKLGASSYELEKLGGGVNNLVYLCRSKDYKWIIKGYPLPNPGQRDGMEADVEFLRYSAHVAQDFTPALLEVDTDRRCVVMEYIQGDTYPEGYIPCQSDLQAGFSFIRKLNRHKQVAAEMIRMDAAEGFLSLRQHMGNIAERLSAMQIEHLPDQCQAQARSILGRIYALAELVSLQLELKIGSGMVEDILNRSDCCISPSDFGFHNAIRMSEGVKFIDFEFAGWDDPCKLCVDFVLQQRNPVRLKPIHVASMLFPGKETLMRNRIDALTEILILKWLCIIMGILNPSKLSRLLTQQCNSTTEAIVDTQIRRFYNYCGRISSYYNT
jgi:hypothetical protein